MTPIQPPMTDDRLDRLVRQLLTERADDVAAVAMPAQTMAAVVGSHVRRGRMPDRRPLLLIAAALLIVLVAGAVAVGSSLRRETVEPQPTPIPVVPLPSAPAVAPQRVFYTDYQEIRVGEPGCTEANAGRFGTCTRSKLWVADTDGSNARELYPQDEEPRRVVAVSSAGDALIFEGVAEVNGQRVNGAFLAEIGRSGDVGESRIVSHVVLDDGCDGVCAFDVEFSFSPDGTQLAYVRYARQGDEDYDTVIALQDVATGDVTEVDSTRTSATNGYNSAPRWSPDGSRILFARDSKGVPSDRTANKTAYLVNADGSDLRQLVPSELSARDGVWSPDGETVAFTSAIGWLGLDPRTGVRDQYNEDSDVYTVRADGSDVRRLTTFAPVRKEVGVPVQQGGHVQGWTRDGRIVFSLIRWAGVEGDSTTLPPETWVMDADGGNATRLDGSDLAALTAAGCIDCPYSPSSDDLQFTGFWRPALVDPR